ncbi:MAG: FMN-binding protein, partial [Pseudomonadales bacterium]|nr:FMN-binding protein [Pseudomonadales bacterium]
LTQPALNGWTVKKDGGVFDQFTGATVTPRAVILATRRALEYTSLNAARLFETEKDSA